MNERNNSHTKRRTVLKVASSALTGFTALAATNSVNAQSKSIHEKMGELSVEIVCDELSNDTVCDYVGVISDYADEPDDDPVWCPSSYPDFVCEFYEVTQQKPEHYRNPKEDWGFVNEAAADEAKKAKDYIGDGDHFGAARHTARALHFIQDAGTLVHTGREYEQSLNWDIHFDYEEWVNDEWSNHFKDELEGVGIADIEDRDHIESLVGHLVQWSHDYLQDQWSDIKTHSSGYSSSTMEAQTTRMKDAMVISNGVVEWIWKDA